MNEDLYPQHPGAPLLVYIESPFAGNEFHTEEDHKIYLRRCIQDSLSRLEAPFASHRMFTDALDDANEAQRKQGMEAGLAWMRASQHVAVYVDYGISRGMRWGIENAKTLGIVVSSRSIGFNSSGTRVANPVNRQEQSVVDLFSCTLTVH